MEKPALVHYMNNPKTLGDHIRKARVERELSQYEVAVFEYRKTLSHIGRTTEPNRTCGTIRRFWYSSDTIRLTCPLTRSVNGSHSIATATG